MKKITKTGKHSWRPGFPNKKILATVVSKELKALEKEEGDILPESVVKKAKAKSSPLHEFFTWDDTIAAEEYRLEQARGLIRAVFVTLKVEDKSYNVRAYYNVSPEDGTPRRYRAVEQVAADKQHLDIIVERAWAELEAWQARYDTLAGLQVAVEQVRVALEKRPKTVNRKKSSRGGVRA